jgi:CBS domain-containing protein
VQSPEAVKEETMVVRRAKDLMIPLDSYPHIPYWSTLAQAMAYLAEAEFNMGGRKSLPRCVLVFNEAYNLLGMARRRDILRGLDPKSLAKINRARTLRDDPGTAHAKLQKSIQQKLARPISDVMKTIQDSVDHDDDVIEVIRRMVDRDLSFIPVMKEGKVVGVVRTVEIMNELSPIYNGPPADAVPARKKPVP